MRPSHDVSSTSTKGERIVTTLHPESFPKDAVRAENLLPLKESLLCSLPQFKLSVRRLSSIVQEKLEISFLKKKWKIFLCTIFASKRRKFEEIGFKKNFCVHVFPVCNFDHFVTNNYAKRYHRNNRTQMPRRCLRVDRLLDKNAIRPLATVCSYIYRHREFSWTGALWTFWTKISLCFAVLQLNFGW